MLIYGIFRYGILDMNHNVYYVFVCFHLLNCHYTLAIALVTAVSKQQLQWCLGGGWPVSLQLGPPCPLAYDSLDVTCCPSQPWNSLGFKFPLYEYVCIYIYIYIPWLLVKYIPDLPTICPPWRTENDPFSRYPTRASLADLLRPSDCPRTHLRHVFTTVHRQWDENKLCNK